MKIMFNFWRVKPPKWQYPIWDILPYIRIWYKRDTFLETGVYTKAVSFEFGWLKWTWQGIIQKVY